MKFDIEELYRSISEDLLKKAINYAKTFVDISSDEEEIILCNVEYLYFSIIQIYRKKKRATRILKLLWAALMAQKFASWLAFIFYIY